MDVAMGDCLPGCDPSYRLTRVRISIISRTAQHRRLRRSGSWLLILLSKPSNALGTAAAPLLQSSLPDHDIGPNGCIGQFDALHLNVLSGLDAGA